MFLTNSFLFHHLLPFHLVIIQLAVFPQQQRSCNFFTCNVRGHSSPSFNILQFTLQRLITDFPLVTLFFFVYPHTNTNSFITQFLYFFLFHTVLVLRNFQKIFCLCHSILMLRYCLSYHPYKLQHVNVTIKPTKQPRRNVNNGSIVSVIFSSKICPFDAT